MGRQQGRGGIGSHKHGTAGRAGPPSGVKRSAAQFFNQEKERREKLRAKRTGPMFASIRQALKKIKPT